MKIVCSANMPFVREAFETLGEVVVKQGRDIQAQDVRDAEILAVRSTTPITAGLLEGSRLRFVGTATIGTDHMDLDALDRKGVAWCYSPGCNANSVAEYVTAALLCLADRHTCAWTGKTIGVIGVGNVGSRVVEKAHALGMQVLRNDPPRGRTGCPEVFYPLDEVLAAADILSLHVPLTREGPDATYHMANASFFEKVKPGCLFINSARGAVVETDALKQAIAAGVVSQAVIDTWEGEPAYRHDLLPMMDLATPHIAGYSFEGRVNGTVNVYREACRFLGVEADWTPEALLPEPVVPEVHIEAAGRTDEAVLWEAVRQVYDIEADDARMRETAVDDSAERASSFDALRKHYPVRREFTNTRCVVRNGNKALDESLRGLGFAIGVDDPGN